MSNLNQLQQCFICSAKYNVMIPVEYSPSGWGDLTLEQALQSLHFLDVSDCATFDRTLCCICTAKVQSLYKFKKKCERIENSVNASIPLDISIVPVTKIKSENVYDYNESAIFHEEYHEDTFPTTTEKCGSKISRKVNDPLLNTNMVNEESGPVVHQRTEKRPEKPVTCPICRKTFSRKVTFDDHYRTHTGETPYVCDVCNSSFVRLQSLKRHKLFHSVTRPHVCDVCNKAFYRSDHLSEHKLIHSEEKPHVCDVCSKGFTRSNDLKKHKAIHTGEKNYVCDFCNKSFGHPSTLFKHRMIHTGEKPYVCDVCNKAFIQCGDLKKHKLIHTGARPYVCDICNKSFLHVHHLVSHKLTHNEKKPHVCDVCNKSFSQSCHLVRHKMTHLSDETSRL